MVAACLVQQSQVLLTAKPQMTDVCLKLSVDQLRDKLLSAVENGQINDVQAILDDLEKAPITKDILESTRIGASVNDVRKKIADRWPDASKKCRTLIKSWQKLVEVRPPSCASSTNGTPNLVSPSLAKLNRKVTPGTPVNRRVTSTGLSNGRGLTVSPANGSYAPKELLSPNGMMHKSQSVGTDLLAKGDENKLCTAKRKLEECVSSTMKRNKTVVGLSSSVGVSHSVSAARMAVQSTSELVAQLSQNLPEHMAIDTSLKEHEEKVKREQQDEEFAISLHGTLAGPYQQSERKKRKYERKIKLEQEDISESLPVEERRGGLILRLPRYQKEIKQERSELVIEPPRQSSQPSSRPESRPESRIEARPTGRKVNWLDMLPSLDELRRRAEERRTQSINTFADPKKVYTLPIGEQKFVVLPYLEDPTVPDFITYDYQNKAQYYADDTLQIA